MTYKTIITIEIADVEFDVECVFDFEKGDDAVLMGHPDHASPASDNTYQIYILTIKDAKSTYSVSWLAEVILEVIIEKLEASDKFNWTSTELPPLCQSTCTTDKGCSCANLALKKSIMHDFGDTK